jgi:drug/metabolite transporter (DMT)-like permease
VPLFIVASAAFFLREHVGWRRWLAAGVGFLGVLLIIRPGTETFTPWALLALLAVGFVALRDLATRRIDPALPSLLVTLITAASVSVLGYLVYPLQTWQMPTPFAWGMLAIAAICMAVAYYAMVLAMRSGDIAVVSPFRYSVVLWALLSGYIVWGDKPDGLALAGTVIVVAAGLYTFLRERRLKMEPAYR